MRVKRKKKVKKHEVTLHELKLAHDFCNKVGGHRIAAIALDFLKRLRELPP